jgi:hypothetical protein
MTSSISSFAAAICETIQALGSENESAGLASQAEVAVVKQK